MRVSFEGLPGYIFKDDTQNLWWVPEDGRPTQLLTDINSVCGVCFFNTGTTDPFLDACKWHDQAYMRRQDYEQNGWDRQRIDKHFYELMHAEIIKTGRVDLIPRAQMYFDLVRCIGWVFYYRH